MYEYSGDEIVYGPQCGENFDYRWKGNKVEVFFQEENNE